MFAGVPRPTNLPQASNMIILLGGRKSGCGKTMPRKETMKWKVELRGHPFDLEELPAWLSGGDPTVLKEDQDFVMVSSRFEGMTNSADVERAAVEIIGLINGLAPAIWRDFQPIEVGSPIFIDPDGNLHRYAHVSGTMKARSKLKASVITKQGDASEPTQGLLASLLPTVFESEEIQRALAFIGHRNLTWSDLYRTVEVVKDDVGGTIHKKGWISKSALSRFRRTANSFTALGTDARHAQERYQPPRQPMSFGEARTAVLNLVRAWVESKTETETEER